MKAMIHSISTSWVWGQKPEPSDLRITIEMTTNETDGYVRLVGGPVYIYPQSRWNTFIDRWLK